MNIACCQYKGHYVTLTQLWECFVIAYIISLNLNNCLVYVKSIISKNTCSVSYQLWNALANSWHELEHRESSGLGFLEKVQLVHCGISDSPDRLKLWLLHVSFLEIVSTGQVKFLEPVLVTLTDKQKMQVDGGKYWIEPKWKSRDVPSLSKKGWTGKHLIPLNQQSIHDFYVHTLM